MSVTIKSSREIELMREAGRILAIVHQELEKAVTEATNGKAGWTKVKELYYIA